MAAAAGTDGNGDATIRAVPGRRGNPECPRRRSLLSVSGILLASLAAACARAPAAVGPRLPLALTPWPPALPATHEALSTVLQARRAYDARRGPSGAREQVFAWYLSALAHNGPLSTPELFPTEADALAYALNAHIAWVIALGETPALRRRSVQTLRELPFPLDGRTSTLAQIEGEVVARAPSEPRAALLLNPGWRGGPPLPSCAVEARALEFQLANQARVTGESPGFWGIDRQRRAVSVSAFTDLMWGLPRDRHRRTRRLLELIPPPADVADAIVGTCGATLLRCSITSSPFDADRLIEPGPQT